MFNNTVKTIIGILFIPFAIAVTQAFFRSLKALDFLNINLFILIGGFFSYPVFRIVFYKPNYIYALGHEAVHVVATWICGGKVTSFQVSEAGGSVTTTKTNPFIRLAPYFIPIHTLFLFLLYWALLRFFNVTRFFNAFIFLAGFTMSMHIFMTIETMKTAQPDIAKTGYFFSALLIYVANIFVLVFTISLILRDISFLHFARNTFVVAKDIYLNFFGKLLK
ncbi:MAG: hypothetical protein JW994_03745 [Candidatus Omnitrophica bacterium]|nr:hypothetical protein [Candidatus Omnitrophota bacterium]